MGGLTMSGRLGHCVLIVFLLAEVLADDYVPISVPDPPGEAQVRLSSGPSTGWKTITFVEEAPVPFTIIEIKKIGEYSKPISNVWSTNGNLLGIGDYTDGGDHWILEVTEKQDYEKNENRKYSIDVNYANFTPLNVAVRVENINDNPPVMSTNTPICSVDENWTGTTNCVITVTDIDEDYGNFSIVVKESNITSTTFSSIYQVGEENEVITLTVLQELNYEAQNIYLLEVNVLDGNFTSHQPISIKVNDLDDLPPAWITTNPVYSIPEEKPFEVRLSAYDQDISINAPIYYRLNSTSDYFSINRTSGVLSVSAIDRDVQGQDKFQFYAIAYEDDTIHPVKPPHEATLKLTFMILDINDNPPRFNRRKANASMDEGSSTLNIGKIIVTDPDMSENGTFNVELRNAAAGGANYISAFSVVPSQGYQNASFSIAVVDPNLLDYENKDWRKIHMTLVATGVADSTQVDHMDIYINLKNTNDEFPKFNQTQYESSVMENVTEGYLITTLTAVDADGLITSGGIDTITYTTTSVNIVSVDPESGEIRVKANNTFDYETQRAVFVQVTATDAVGHPAYAQLKINVQDVDDVAPTLHMPPERVTVMEDAATDAPVAGSDICATDPDTDADLHFNIDWRTSSATKNGIPVETSLFIDYFNIIPKPTFDSAEHCAILTVAKRLHWDVFDTITLNITVTDINTLPSLPERAERSATLTIAIIDVNDNKPTIIPIPVLSVDENSKVNQAIGNVVASDKDFNTTLRYYLTSIGDTPADWVKISENKGLLYVGSPDIDREAVDVLEYTVRVNDGASDSFANVTIEVEDLNDNSPNITNPQPMNAAIPENSPNKTKIFQINAVDHDKTAPFNEVSYIMDPLYPNPYFAVDVDDGWITVSLKPGAVLDREASDTQVIHIAVRDNYNETSDYNSHSTPGYVTLKLQDENDEYPQFREKPQDCQDDKEVLETTGQGQLLFSITAIDKDEKNTPYSTIVFTIMEIVPLDGSKDPNDGDSEHPLFNISTSFIDPNYKGDVISGRPLEGYYGKYNITIQATDSDPEAPKSTKQTYTICIEDVNDNAPIIVFPQPGSVFRIFDTQEPRQDIILDDNTVLTPFRATDADSGRNGEVTFDITGTDYAKRYFDIIPGNETNTGRLILTKQLDIDELESREFQMEINATDNGVQVQQHSMTTATILILTNEPHEPYFNDSTFQITIEENLKTQFDFPGAVDVDNLYKPIELQESVYYFIVAGNKSLFALDKNTTTLKIVQGMDYEFKTEEKITIKASNSKSEPNITNGFQGRDFLNITINVADQNDVTPKFIYDEYIGGIAPEDLIGSQVFPVKAVDPDTNDHILYSLMWETMKANGSLHSYINTSFNLDNKTGELTLLFQPQEYMTGYFSFQMSATDCADHVAVVDAKVFPITVANREKFTFDNNHEYVEQQQEKVAMVLTDNLNLTCNIKYIQPDVDSSGKPTNSTVVSTLFMDDKLQVPVDSIIITQSINIFDTKNMIKKEFIEYGLIWKDFVANAEKPNSTNEGLHQTILIAVAAVLATLVFLLLAAFFFKTRSLNRRLEALSQTKFGSVDSGLNRVNMNVPNTNQHALEGSNPVWNEEIDNNDNVSVGSGDSDLIGVEDNPEFKPQGGAHSGTNGHHDDPNFSFGEGRPSAPTTEL